MREIEEIVDDEYFDQCLQAAVISKALLEAMAADEDLTSVADDEDLCLAVDKIGRGMIATACALKNHAVARQLLAIIDDPGYEAEFSGGPPGDPSELLGEEL